MNKIISLTTILIIFTVLTTQALKIPTTAGSQQDFVLQIEVLEDEANTTPDCALKFILGDKVNSSEYRELKVKNNGSTASILAILIAARRSDLRISAWWDNQGYITRIYY